MKPIPLTAIVAALALILASCANEVPAGEQAELVPIPAYDPPFGKADAAASLKAAEAFLASFDEKTRAEIVLDLDAEERAGWSNLPAGSVTRAGISIDDLSDGQRRLLFQFLASSLSEEGYRRVGDVIAAEALLSEDWPLSWILGWAPEYYWISFYGTPSATSPWGWAFGGHHLALNVSVEDNRVASMSPSFVGTEPAVFTHNGVAYEAVIDMHRAGFALYAALDGAQKDAADAGEVPDELYTGAGKDGVVPPTVGLSTSEMSPDQKALLLAAIDRWVSIQPSENALRRMAALEAELDRTYFAWTGADDAETPTYMLIQGPTLIVELLSTGNDEGHYHTVYRNPTSEYGGLGPRP